MTLFVLFPRTDAPECGMSGAAELAYQLRGAPVFEQLDAFNLVTLPKRNSDKMATPMRFDPSHLVYVDLGLAVDNPWIVDRLVNLRIPYIVDVHLPFGRRPAMRAIQPGRDDETRDPELDEAAADLWSGPEQMAKALAVMDRAAAIITPRQAWAELLKPYADTRNLSWLDGEITLASEGRLILGRGGSRLFRESNYLRPYVVPDVVSPESGAQFYREFCRAAWAAKRMGRTSRFISGFAVRRGAKVMLRRLTESGVDWNARLSGVA